MDQLIETQHGISKRLTTLPYIIIVSKYFPDVSTILNLLTFNLEC